MTEHQRRQLQGAICARAGVGDALAIDPGRLQAWIQIILQFLPAFLAFFKTPAPTPTPNPVQEGPAITTLEGLLDYIDKTMQLHKLTAVQQLTVTNAVDAMAAFLELAA